MMIKTKQQEAAVFDIDNTNSSLVTFSLGNTLRVDKVNNELQLLNVNQELQLSIKITNEGLILNINAKELNINAGEQLNLSSKKININASEQINIKTAGNLVHQVKKDLLTEVGGTNKQIAQVQKITATFGNAEIKANDYVKLDGESVLLNCEE